MPWIDIPSARADADYSLDAGTTRAIHARLDQIYTQSTFDLCVPADPPGAARNASTSTTTWSWLGHPFMVPARVKEGGAPRDIVFECQARGSAADSWDLRAYLLDTRARPALDDTDAVIDNSAYVELSVASSSYSYKSSAITPDAFDVYGGDGLIRGFSQPIYWLHLCHKGTAAITVYVRDLRLYESLS